MIVLDTNVVSELMREGSAPQVREWFFAQSASDVYRSAITEAELRYGIAIIAGWTTAQHARDCP